MCIRKSSCYANPYMTSIISVLCYAYTNLTLLKFDRLLRPDQFDYVFYITYVTKNKGGDKRKYK